MVTKMSEKLSLWAAIKDNWGQITAIGGALVVLHLFVMGVMVWTAVDKQLGSHTTTHASVDLGATQKIINMDKVAASNTRTGEENGEDIDQIRNNTEAAFRRLMGMPASNEND